MTFSRATNSFNILGPFQVRVADQDVTVGSGKLRVLLTALLIQANNVVSSDQLIDWLWDDEDRLANPRGTLHTYVRRLRRLLGSPGLLSTTSTGYRLNIDPDELDLFRFRRLVGQAAQTADPEKQADLLRAALAIWRGPALADIPSEALRREELAGLDEERLHAQESWFDVELRLGRHSELIRSLRAAANENPFREAFWGLLMVALYRSGRQAEALDTYRRARATLIDELGVEPGERLTAVHRGILESHPALAVPTVSAVEKVAHDPVPAQLPPEAIGFVGRRALVDRLGAGLRPIETRTGVPIVVLSGPPGVGKTALAVSLGRRVRDSFPDGQLFVNLRGYERRGEDSPLTAGQVLSQFLRSLGVPAKQIPVKLDEQVNLFRSKLSGTHVLVVLDNASSMEQVMPLIPGDPGCSVLITSRQRLQGLGASQGAQVIQIGTLRPAESVELIETMLSNAGAEVEPEVVAEVGALCAHLPLALRIASANLINAPGGQITDYLETLRRGNRLAALTLDGDPTSAVSATIASSYDVMEPEDQRALRFAGLFPGADFSAAVLAVLTGSTPAQALRSLTTISAANLLHQHTPGRFQFHDLLREYARDQASAGHTDKERAAAMARLGQWYLDGTRNAAHLLHSEFVRLAPHPDETTTVDAPQFTDESQAMTWLQAEWRNVADLIQFFGSSGPRHLSWYLADAMRGFFWTGKYRTEWQEASLPSLASAEDCGDPRGAAAMHRSLANLNNTLGDYHQAIQHHHACLLVHRDLEMPEEIAATLNNLGLAHLSLGQLVEAEAVAREALQIARDIGSPRTKATAEGLLGSIQWAHGDMAGATASISSSLRTAKAHHLYHISSYSLRTLGLILQAVGDLAEAKSYFTEALEASDRISSFYDRSISLYGLALVHHDYGDGQAAFEYAQQALVAFQECGDRTYEAETLCVMSAIMADLGDWTGSANYARAAFEGAHQIDYIDGEAYALARLATIDSHFGRVAAARTGAEAALAALDRSDNQITQRKVLSEIGPVHLRNGDLDRARRCGERLLTISGSTGQRLGVARGQVLLGSVAHLSGDDRRAAPLWRQAREIFTEIGVPDTGAGRALLDPLGPAVAALGGTGSAVTLRIATPRRPR